jgi:predicted Zn-dependent peptidase
MRSLKVTQENLDNQRDAVKEEKRLRYDNQPYINAFLRISELIYQNPHNAHSTIGSMEDLDAATVEDVREFFRIYYAPNNAVLTIVGDFDPAEARAQVEKYFGSIPAQAAPPPIDVSEPEEVALRADVYHDKFAPSLAFIMGWKAPARRADDAYALALASDLLVGGESSRLYQKLVKEDESVLAIQGGFGERRGPSSFYLFALLKEGKDPQQIREQIMREIKSLATEGASAQEMEKLRNNLLNDDVRALQSSMYRAQRLAEYALYDGDPELINTDLERYLAVTADDIKNAVAHYLDTDNRTVLEIVPAADDAGADEPAPSAALHDGGTHEEPGAPPPQVPAAQPSEPAPKAEDIVNAAARTEPTHPPHPTKVDSAPEQK